MPPERKRRKMSQEREDLSAAKPERVDYGGPLGAGTIKREEKRFKRERPVGWGARAGSTIWDLKGSQ